MQISPMELIRRATPGQRRTLLAAALGWALDAFDAMLYALVLTLLMRDLGMSNTVSRRQHDPRPQRESRTDRAGTGQGLQPRPITLTQHQRRSNRHASLSRTTNRKHSYDTQHYRAVAGAATATRSNWSCGTV